MRSRKRDKEIEKIFNRTKLNREKNYGGEERDTRRKTETESDKEREYIYQSRSKQRKELW